MPEITPETTAKALIAEIDRHLSNLERIAASCDPAPDLATVVAAVKITAEILTTIEALDTAAFAEPSATTFKSVLARLVRPKDNKAVKRAIADLKEDLHPIIIRAKPYDPEDYPF